MEHEIVMVEWLDSRGVSTEWESVKHIKDDKPSICHATSVGFVVHKDEKIICIAGHMADPEDPQYTGIMTIPMCSVIKIHSVIKISGDPS